MFFLFFYARAVARRGRFATLGQYKNTNRNSSILIPNISAFPFYHFTTKILYILNNPDSRKRYTRSIFVPFVPAFSMYQTAQNMLRRMFINYFSPRPLLSYFYKTISSSAAADLWIVEEGREREGGNIGQEDNRGFLVIFRTVSRLHL